MIIQTAALLRSAWIRVQEIWGDLLSLRLQKKTSANAQKRKNNLKFDSQNSLVSCKYKTLTDDIDASI